MPSNELPEQLDEKTLKKIAELLTEANAQQQISDEPISEEKQKGLVSALKKTYQDFLISHNFTQGDLVEWKDNLKNKKMPRDNEPAIVVQILDAPVFDNEDSGSPYFREPLDMVIGVLGKREEMLLFHVDSRRFKPFQETVEQARQKVD
ncbi:MAG: hypothetical protein WA821_00570 [Anaerolineales bacterium]